MYVIKGTIEKMHNPIHAIALPTNGTFREDGTAMIDDSVTENMSKIFPNFSIALGDRLELYGNHVFYFSDWNLFTFPTADKAFEKMDIKLIEQSCYELSVHEEYIKGRPILIPKIGSLYNGVTWADVEALLDRYVHDILVINGQ